MFATSTMTKDKYTRKKTSVSQINYHFVFCPKRRKRVLVNDIGRRLEEIIYQKAKELECDILALEIMPDHVHLFIRCPPTIAPHQIMFRIKGSSSRLLRKEFPQLLKLPSLWTRSYYCGTAGDVSSETIKKYIANQHTR